jgi:1,4-alpha-glucan branching enzyme
MDKVRLILTNDECHNDLVADPVARYIDKKVEDTKIFIETQYATKEEVITKEEVENIVSEGVKVNAIDYGTF